MPSIPSVIAGIVAGAARDRGANEDRQLQEAQMSAAVLEASARRRPQGRRSPPPEASAKAGSAPPRDARTVAGSASDPGSRPAGEDVRRPSRADEGPPEGGPIAGLKRFFERLMSGRPGGA